MKSQCLLLLALVFLLTPACADQVVAPVTEDVLPRADALSAESIESTCRVCGVNVPNVVGSWEGSVTFEGDRTTGTVLLEVTSQDRTQFEGRLQFDVSAALPVREFEIDGTVTPDADSRPGSRSPEGGPLFGMQFSSNDGSADGGPIVILIIKAQYDDTGAVPVIEGTGRYVTTDSDSGEDRVDDLHIELYWIPPS